MRESKLANIVIREYIAIRTGRLKYVITQNHAACVILTHHAELLCVIWPT